MRESLGVFECRWFLLMLLDQRYSQGEGSKKKRLGGWFIRCI